MRIAHVVAFAALVAASAFTVAQNSAPDPAMRPEQNVPTAGQAPPAGAVRPRAGSGGANASGRPNDANSPAQAGRQALYKYLDDIAAKDTAARRAEIAKITTREQAEVRQQEVRAKILDLMGGSFEKTALNAKVLGSTQMDGFRIEKVLYESQPKFYVTALLYLPDGVPSEATKGGPQGLKPGSAMSANGTAEAVPLSKTGSATTAEAVPLSKTGSAATAEAVRLGKTSAGGKTPAGPSTARTADASRSAQDDKSSVKFPAIVMAPGHAASGKAGDYALAATFARNGFAVLSYDPIGQGERLQYPDPATISKGLAAGSLATKPTGEHGEAGLQPTLIGDAVARYFAWDGMRAVDYLVSRPEIDPERIGAEGCSGGGAMTALLGAADKRVKATATACYLTTMDALLPSIGAQDAEQSTPGFIESGFDFADWVELAAPRPYAMVGTVSDMFPWKGFLETAQEARRFYGLFDARAAGVEPSRTSDASPLLVTPTGPTLNPDTINKVSADAPFQVITGIGGHGNLRPITAQIVGFFLVNLAGRKAEDYVAPPIAAAGASPLAAPAGVPAGALQVTPTGQVASSYPDAATVHSLNLKRAAGKIPQYPTLTLLQVQTDVREVTKAEAVADAPPVAPPQVTIRVRSNDESEPNYFHQFVRLSTDAGISLEGEMVEPRGSERRPARLILTADGTAAQHKDHPEYEMPNTVVLAFTPRPSPPGVEEIKSPILGPFYMTELRAELVGKTLLGMRVDDVIRAVDYLASRADVDPANITVVASGHMGLVALHAAVLDKRIQHVAVDHVLESYASLLRAPMPLDAPQDILPGVLLKYDIPDLVRVLGTRVTATDWLPGTANLAAK